MDSDSDTNVVDGQYYESFSDENSDSDSSSSDEEEQEMDWLFQLQLIKENDPTITTLNQHGDNHGIQNMTDEEWEELGYAISNNTHLTAFYLWYGAINDQKMSFLFRGLTRRSSSVQHIGLTHDELSVAGIRSMVPFLQNTSSLTFLNLSNNNLQSEGFNLLLRALSDSPIKTLYCVNCRIESIEIDCEHVPRHLRGLDLADNSINAAGCSGLAKLLHGEDATLESLSLQRNQIDDDGVEILVEALQKNTSLQTLDLTGNDRISKRGKTINGNAGIMKIIVAFRLFNC